MQKKKKHRLLTLLAVLIIAAIIAFIALGIASFVRAEKMLNLSPTPLEPFATNIIGKHQNISFKSADDQIKLNGWWLSHQGAAASGTIVMVHDRGKNRLQFDLDTAQLYKFLTAEGYNVLSFDQRGAGESSSGLHAYGYNAYEDVISALEYAKKKAPGSPLILMGFAAGNSAIWHAWHELPVEYEADADESTEKTAQILRSDIQAIIMDTPVKSTEDCIIADIEAADLPLKKIFQWSIPLAIRLSAGNSPHIDFLNGMLDAPCPIFLARNGYDDVYSKRNADIIFAEIKRLRPTTSTIFETDGNGHVSAWLDYQGGYKEALSVFLKRWFGN